jgi:predicted nuclease of restriction endonuclease-like (RecB) superfamily
MRAFAEAYPTLQLSQAFLTQLKNNENHLDITLQNDPAKIVQPTVAQLSQLSNTQFVQSLVAQIPWTHHTIILDKTKEIQERLFYIKKTIENGWSKNILKLQIDGNLFQRQGNSINNFELTLPSHESELVKETFKSPYIFDFLTLAEDAKEKDIERGLMYHLKKFMLELGRGFAYVGNQFNLKVENDEYFLDLLFYNINLHCYVIFELKVGDFKPEHTGKLNFYINTVDGEIKGPKDSPTIGILLCKTPNKTEVKYALKGINTPLGIAEYELTSALPKQLKSEMPSIAELEAELEKEYEELKSPSQKKLDALKEKISGLKG